MIIDTHAHLTNEHLASDLGRFLAEAEKVDVGAMLCIGTNLSDSRQSVEMAERYPQIRAAVGIHPNVANEAYDGDWEEIVALCDHPRVAALGETGLDRYWDDCPWEIQVDYFRRHLALSRETKLPVVIHTRECAQETLDVLRDEARHGELCGVMHSCTGPLDVAQACVELGLYIGFAGMVTFKNGSDILDVAAKLPEDRIFVETDAPYLTPHPFRGKRPNHPALVVHTLKKIADARGVPSKVFEDITTKNAERLFGAW